ncbi:hypothetical protein SEPCBS119000_002554 [Sporothrix epigloea]|uniref:Uncharacterized protein n=1 Tax=Sporothrix epigloea TaxID=1892477 RepID=A0ABP0DH00_9PEZI
MNCTDWQLSVEPGYTPYLPPSSFDDDEDEDDDEYDDDDADTTCTIAPPDDTPVERIENWIHGNPSELGDYDSVETNTHTSIAESASGVSSRSLLDLQNSELEWLNEVLTSKNLDTAVSAGSANQSYASVASTIRAPETIGSEFSSSATGKQLKTREQTRAAGTSGLAQGSRSASQTLYSGDSMISQTKTLVGASTAWMESGFQALSIASPQPTQRFETRNGWARPNQRKTYSTAPRYVAHHGDVDHLAHNVLKPSYSYADDDGSEDEC